MKVLYYKDNFEKSKFIFLNYLPSLPAALLAFTVWAQMVNLSPAAAAFNSALISFFGKPLSAVLLVIAFIPPLFSSLALFYSNAISLVNKAGILITLGKVETLLEWNDIAGIKFVPVRSYFILWGTGVYINMKDNRVYKLVFNRFSKFRTFCDEINKTAILAPLNPEDHPTHVLLAELKLTDPYSWPLIFLSITYWLMVFAAALNIFSANRHHYMAITIVVCCILMLLSLIISSITFQLRSKKSS